MYFDYKFLKMATLKELRDERLRKLEELKTLGLDPYPSKVVRTHVLCEITDKFDELNSKHVSVAGRIQNIRKFG
jgi:lysyl-tRNA synthetase class 2